jgi:hypothetical protein
MGGFYATTERSNNSYRPDRELLKLEVSRLEAMLLLVAAFAIYAIVARRIRITRSFTLTGTNARNYGIVLLLTLVPVLLVFRAVLSAVLPHWVYGVPGLTRVIMVICFGAVAFAIAFYFRDQPAPAEPAG